MSKIFSSPADRLRFLRKFMNGYDARDGWRISGENVLLPESLNTKQALKAKAQFEHDLEALLSATSVPYKVSRTRNQNKKEMINKISGVRIQPDKMKVSIVRAESNQSKIKKTYQSGYAVSEGIFTKYYFKYDIKTLIALGAEYIEELVAEVIPRHLSTKFKMLSSFGNVEFNGTFQSAKTIANEILMLSNKYQQDVKRGSFMGTFVVYAYDESFVDVKELGLHLNNFMEVRTYRGGKRRKMKNYDIEI